MVDKYWLKMYAVDRLMSYIVGLMAYTGFVALLGVMAAREVVEGHKSAGAREMFAQIIFDAQKESVSRSSVLQRLRTQLDALHAVEKYRFVSGQKGESTLLEHGVQEPIFISITTKFPHFSAQRVEGMLRKIYPTVRVRRVISNNPSSRSITYMKFICLGLLMLTFFGSIIAIALASQAGLVVNRRIISTMALMGATPLYIVRQFQRHTFKIGGQGALIGLGAMLLTLIMLYFSSSYYGMSLRGLCSVPVMIVSCVGIPVSVVFFMVAATDISVRKYLRFSVDSIDEWSI